MLFGKYVNKFYKKYFVSFLLGIIFLILVDFVQSKVPEYIGDLTARYDEGILTTDYLNKICLYIFLIAIFMFLGRFIWRICILKTSYKISTDLRKEMFDKSEVLSQNYYHKNKVGGIMSYYTNDLDTIQEAYGWGMVMLVDSLVLGGLSFYKMIKVSWQLALICAIPLTALCVAAYFIDNKMEKIYNERQKAFEKMSDYAQELFSGLRVIKAFVKEAKEAIRFKKVNKENQQKDLSLIKFSALLDTLISILIEMMFVIGMIVGGIMIYNNLFDRPGFDFSRAQMLEFIGYLDMIIWPMIALGQIVALRSRAKTSLKRVSVLLDENVDVKDKENLIPLLEIKGKITFKNFSYAYQGETIEALKNVNLEILPGENIGIVGKIGSGKSTLVNALLRVDNVKKGTLFLDDHDIMEIPIKQVRDNISMVPQDNFLFSTPISNNISFSNEKMSEDEIIEAAEFADVHNNIKEFIDGYRTLLGEKGVTLSGGQKQRVSIARAYAKHSPIMILDDSVSAVDVKTEEKILKNIKEKRHGKTTLIVASRVSTVAHLDKIIVMNQGRVEAFANHNELLEISPTYQKMVHLQELENELNEGEKDGK